LPENPCGQSGVEAARLRQGGYTEKLALYNDPIPRLLSSVKWSQ